MGLAPLNRANESVRQWGPFLKSAFEVAGMLRRKWTIGASVLAGLLNSTAAALAAQPQPWQMDFQPAVTPVMAAIEDFHRLLLVIITLISVFVLALLAWIVVRYNKSANPTPSKVSHNTLLEVVWT